MHHPQRRFPRTALPLLLLLALLLPLSARGQQADLQPVADPQAVVQTDRVRITVLTERMLRLEWHPEGTFEDRPTLTVLNRRLPVPEYQSAREDGHLVVRTEHLELRYRIGSGRFGPDNLEITFRLGEGQGRWRPGMLPEGNLGGTIRTLDGVEGPVPLGEGLLSRDGWAVVDDSERPLFDDSDWAWVVPRPRGDHQDWYFLGYGRDYLSALGDFTRIAGRIPMPPRFAFGYWWSRYWAYTDAEFMELVRDFRRYDVPMDVLVVDMDWHETFELRWDTEATDQAGQRLGWTGYTWNRVFFPDPGAFLEWTDERGLRTPFNLHPASGIQPHEAQYEAMARAVGIDPATGEYVPFRIEDKDFARAYFEVVIRPLEEQGIDFWWLDWQQWSDTSIPGLTPTWWLNYVFFTRMERLGTDRPIIFHRYGGLGNHRYQVGFSGDAYSTWEILDFEPSFTATASNVLYGYWSHDIGGHLWGEVSPELYTRWVQFGAFSPILRTHTTKNPDAERRFWAYPPPYFEAMREAIRLRYALVPYIYTTSRQAYETGVSLIRPMYYGWPWAEEAYVFDGQYQFGPDLIVSPVTSPVDSSSVLARRDLWLPPGEWVGWSSGRRLRGPDVVEGTFALDEVPVYARAGAVIPMQPVPERVGEALPDTLELVLMPGPGGETEVYEDSGNSTAYQEGSWSRLPVRQERVSEREVRVRIGPLRGSFPDMPRERVYRLRLPFTWPPERVRADGESLPYRRDEAPGGWTFHGQELETVVTLDRRTVDAGTVVEVRFPYPADHELLDGVPGLLRRMERAMDLLNNTWPDDWAPERFITLVQTGRRITLDPSTARAELQALRDELPGALEAVARMEGDRRWIQRALAHLGRIPGS